MAVPKAVQRQREISDQAIAAMQNKQGQPGAKPPAAAADGDGQKPPVQQQQKEPPAQPPPAQPPNDGQAESLSDVTTRLLASKDQAGKDGEPQQTQQQQPPAQPPADPPQRTDWKSQYLVLKGKYDAEVPAMAAQIRELKDAVQKLRERPAEPAADPKPATDPFDEIRLQGERIGKQYNDPDLGKMIADLAINAAKSVKQPDANTGEVSELRQEISDLRTSSVENQLTNLVPEWRALNVDPEFMQYLTTIDELSGQTYNDMMNHHWQRGDVTSTARFFQRFLESRKPPPGENNSGASIPAHLETPDAQAASGQSSVQDAPKRIALSAIKQLDAEVRRGEWRGRSKELEAIRNEFTLAAAEGRVDYNR